MSALSIRLANHLVVVCYQLSEPGENRYLRYTVLLREILEALMEPLARAKYTSKVPGKDYALIDPLCRDASFRAVDAARAGSLYFVTKTKLQHLLQDAYRSHARRKQKQQQAARETESAPEFKPGAGVLQTDLHELLLLSERVWILSCLCGARLLKTWKGELARIIRDPASASAPRDEEAASAGPVQSWLSRQYKRSKQLHEELQMSRRSYDAGAGEADPVGALLQKAWARSVRALAGPHDEEPTALAEWLRWEVVKLPEKTRAYPESLEAMVRLRTAFEALDDRSFARAREEFRSQIKNPTVRAWDNEPTPLVRLLEALPPLGRAREPSPLELLRAIGRLSPRSAPGKEPSCRRRFDRADLLDHLARRVRGDARLEGVLVAVANTLPLDELLEDELRRLLPLRPELDEAWWGETHRTLGQWGQCLKQARRVAGGAELHTLSVYDLIAIPCLYRHWLGEGGAGQEGDRLGRTAAAVAAAEELVGRWLAAPDGPPRLWVQVPDEHEFVLRCAALTVIFDRFAQMIHDYHEERRNPPDSPGAPPDGPVPGPPAPGP